MYTSLALVLYALSAVQCSVMVTSKLPLKGIQNNMDNSISINEPVTPDDRKLFVDILEAPLPARHTPGDITELSCVAIGHPSPRISWLKNDMPLIQDELESNEIVESSHTSLGSVASVLQIIKASAEKEDVYTCVAESALKTARASSRVYNDIDSIPQVFSSLASLNRHLLAAPRKPRITEHAKTILGNVHTTLVLPCKASGNPTPQVYWHKKTASGSEVTRVNSDGRIQILDSGDLVFTETHWSDLAEYICTAKNEYGKDSAISFLYPIVSKKINSKSNIRMGFE